MLSFETLNDISTTILSDIEDFFKFFEVELRETSNCYIGCCPLHENSDNNGAFVFYKETGIWQCHTHGCHNTFKKTPIGLIRGLLSRNKTGWRKSNDDTFSFPSTIAFVEQFIKNRPKSPINNPKRHAFVARQYKEPVYLNLDIGAYLAEHTCPSKYFLDRGYSPEVLRKFLVGDYNGSQWDLQDRVVVPILDDEMEKILAYTARWTYGKCLMCSGYHDKLHKCPDSKKSSNFIKWQHNKGFSKSSLLYNHWNLAGRKHDEIILVEGPADVWKLEMAGHLNSLGIFGSSLMDRQAQMIRALGPKRVITIMDNDEAGAEAEKECNSKLSGFAEVINIVPEAHDVGEMLVEEIDNLFSEIWT